MWRHDEQDHDSSSQSKHNRVVSSSSTKSSSSSSSRSPFTTDGVPQTPRRTMDEVWRDITLNPTTPIFDTRNHAPYYHYHPGVVTHVAPTATAAGSTTTLSHFRGMILQDFLARPFRGTTPAFSAEEETRCHRGSGGLFGSALTLPPHPSSPATFLCLNSGVDFQYMGRSRSGHLDHPWNQSQSTAGDHQRQSSSSTAVAAAFPDSADPGFSFGNKNRNPEQQHLKSSNGTGNDRRHKRMIKNRESAARSRARKQAYTNELEQEVNQLTEENLRLRRQHEELRARMAAQVLPMTKPLQRSCTAPF